MKSKFIQNGYFLLLTFVTGLFYFCFYLIALLFSFTLSFTVVGIPLIMRVLQTTTHFIQFERIQTKIYTDISTDSYDRNITMDTSNWAQVKLVLTDRCTWSAVYWLMQKFVVGIFSLISAIIFYVMPLMFLLAPLLYRYIDMNIIFIQIDTFAKSLFVMFMGIVFTAISIRIVEGLTQKIGGYTRSMIQQLNQ
ncbi:sensor domain-containing protein [Bacillus thuringiensis]|uniref:Sensor domain-containing protein n=2 Tax=Bacillus cereus group TaxID=86661 RepID=A0ABD7DIF6_BACCE|nr:MULTISPECIES: sensor domain-containing protein [Bacillus cereus group]AQY39726.1 luciferase [Bacillus thuringiensis]MDO6630306.1 sensor domain-containing protein [Bacillus thuringiensis]MDO6700405.1 sensor domain-containing protein [Bacillus thuringiensis]MDR4147402.1 luciferase [Bacillus thuringiensis]MEC3571321.1 sensor domain-containing protein [Bacillus thuringiensis]